MHVHVHCTCTFNYNTVHVHAFSMYMYQPLTTKNVYVPYKFYMYMYMYYCVCYSHQTREEAKVRVEKELTEKQEKVQIEIEKCHRRVEELSEYSDLGSIPHYCKDVGHIQKTLTEIQEQIVQINKEEELFKWQPSTYPEIDQIRSGLEPYQKLFTTILRYNGRVACTCMMIYCTCSIMPKH